MYSCTSVFPVGVLADFCDTHAINIGKKSCTRQSASLTIKSPQARTRESWRIVSTLGVWVNIVAASLPVAISVVLAKI